MNPRETIAAFDRHLAANGIRFEAVVIGGSALVLAGIIDRPTRDCDVLSPQIPERVAVAARSFAARVREQGGVLGDEWLNNGPSSLAASLPSGWLKRVVPLFSGKALALSGLGRADLLKTKLFAFCDRRIDIDDCLALAPTQAELDEAQPWVAYQDANEQWPRYVAQSFSELSQRLGHGV